MATKILNGRELAGFVKERQAHVVKMLRSNKIKAKLVIVRDSENPVITKYVNLKRRYGEDIGVEVEDVFVDCSGVDSEEKKAELISVVKKASNDPEVHGIIVQLPLVNKEWTDEVVAEIAPEKDVDGLTGKGNFDSATAGAINWLMAGYNIELDGKKIAIVGKGRLVGMPLIKMWKNSGFNVTVFDSKSNVADLINYDVIVTATGKPHLIKSEYVKPGAVIIDAGTASEDGVLVGDVDEAVRERKDLGAITPKVGGVGPLTVGVLFEDVLSAASKTQK